MQSCATTQIEYIREYPDLDWPDFPSLQGKYNTCGKTVEITLEEFILLAEFKIDYDALKDFYDELKKEEEK